MALPSTPEPFWENAVSTALTTHDLPLNSLRRAFDALVDAPVPMSVDGEAIGSGLPERDLPLAEIKSLLMSRRTLESAKRALWCAVVDMAQSEGGAWRVAAVGLAYPGLAGAVLRVVKAAPGDVHDLQAEMLAEFLAALAVIDVDDPEITDIAGWLCFRALTNSWKARTALGECGVHAPSVPGAVIPLFPAGHPDIVLARAVRTGVLTEAEADLLGRRYLEDEHYTSLAKSYKISLATLYRRLNAARDRLAAALQGGVLRPF
jgi:predicted DNA-binding protein (UPF0251 family)